MAKDTQLEKILSKDSLTLLPGVFDAISAKLAEKAGAEAVVITGFSVSATLLGEPDLGLLTSTHLVNVAKAICNSIKIPVIVDGDTGYGGVVQVARLVEELIQIGAKGVILEDQVWPKKSGHLQGKHVISLHEHVKKISAACQTKADEDFLVIARTDAREAHGLTEAILRGRAYAEAGADMIFIEAPYSIDEIEVIAEEIHAPLLISMVEGGKTPIVAGDHLNNLGFSAVAYPLTGLLAVAKTLQRTYSQLLDLGMSNFPQNTMMNFKEINELLDLSKKDEFMLEQID